MQLAFNCSYHSFKIFPQFWLAKSTRTIHHNQLLMNICGAGQTNVHYAEDELNIDAGKHVFAVSKLGIILNE